MPRSTWRAILTMAVPRIAVVCATHGTAVAHAQVPAYRLNVRVVPESAWMAVRGTLTLPPSDSARHEIRLALSSVFANAQCTIDTPQRAAVQTSSTSGNTTIWSLKTPAPIPAHMRIVLHFAYSADVPAVRAFHVGADGSFVELGWYPQDSEALRRGNRATGTIAIEVPAGLTAVATGERESTADEERRGHFFFATSQPRRLAFVAGHYTLHRLASNSAGPPIAVYLLADRASADTFLTGTVHALNALVPLFGRFPYPELSVVEVPSGPARSSGFGGHSVNGLVFVTSDNFDKGFNLGFFAHELSHQWWADLLEPRGTTGEEMMLTEAMASYGSLRAVERIEGRAAAEQYRRVGYPGFSDTDLAYYLRFNATGLDTVPLARLENLQLAHDLSGTKGFRVWDMLSREVGRQRFDSALRAFAVTHAYQQFTWSDFTQAITRAAGRPLDWFFAQWATARTGAPEWSVHWSQLRDTVRVSITQEGPAYRLPVQVAMTGSSPGDSILEHVTLTGHSAQYSWPSRFTVRDVVVDPHFLVMHWPAGVTEEIRGSAPIDRANWLDLLGYPERALAAYDATLDSIPPTDKWALRYQAEYGRSWLLLRAKRWDEARHSMLDAIAIGDTSNVAQSLPCRKPGGSCAAPWGWYLVASASRELADTVQLCHAIASATAADTASRWGAASALHPWSNACSVEHRPTVSSVSIHTGRLSRERSPRAPAAVCLGEPTPKYPSEYQPQLLGRT
jgi:hypothetical protein